VDWINLPEDKEQWWGLSSRKKIKIKIKIEGNQVK
jgi:hypothetical protein